MKSATINYWLYLLSANANNLIYHLYQENTLRKDGLCSKICLLSSLNQKKFQWLIYLSSSLIDKECNNLDLENVP
jgi:hypothetical protein